MRPTPALVLAALAAIFLWAGAGVSNAEVRDLERQTSQAKREVDRVSQALVQGRERLDSAEAESQAAAAEEAELSGLIAGGAERSAELAGRVARLEKKLEGSRERLRRARTLLAERLAAIYMNGTPDMVEVALGAASFDELATQKEYFDAVRDADVRLAARVRTVRNELDSRTDRLVALKGRVDSHNAELAAARVGISAARQAAQSSAAQLASVTAGREAKISRLKSDIAGWRKRIEREQQVTEEEAVEQVESNLGGPYSIPTYIVMCESGGNYSALNPSSGAGGAYQIIPSTWEYYGGKGLPHEASKAEQDRIAALIWENDGPGAWVCA